jgi:transcriptional regulator with XRE-family HTH domain
MTSARRGEPDERQPTTRPSRPAGSPDSTTAGRQGLKQQLAAALRDAVRAEERRTGRSLDKAVLARRVTVSRNSVYAYLEGRRLPSAPVLDALLIELSVNADERCRLGMLRDSIADYRQHAGGLESNAEPDEVDAEPPETNGEPADSRGGGRGRMLRLLPRAWARRTLVSASAACLVVGAAAGGMSLWQARQPEAVIRKGASAVGLTGHSGHACTDPSCAYVSIQLRRFTPHHTYLVTCRSDGGMDPLENRNGFYTVRMSTDDRGNSILSDPTSCMWGYQATHVWVSVQSNDGIPEVTSNAVSW